MSDDWSLDEYATSEIKIGHTDGSYVTIKFPDDHYVYTNKAIEQLRQKLIEDVTAMREDLFTGGNWKTVVLSIIKKRFGEE